ncbi:unnamed protein product, partial [Pocillopora meandrina]
MAHRNETSNLNPDDLDLSADFHTRNIRIHEHLIPRLQQLLSETNKLKSTHQFQYLMEMASHKEMKDLAKENKFLLMELPYYNCKDLKNAHLQYNALLDTNLASRKSIYSFNSLYDLGLFQ